MSVVRLVMVENNKALSGHIPSAAISAILWAISDKAIDVKSLWNTVNRVDPGLQDHFTANVDDSPLLEGYGDGLIVISWDHKCIESFQAYQPVQRTGHTPIHNGQFLEDKLKPLEYSVPDEWNIIDYHFEESRH